MYSEYTALFTHSTQRTCTVSYIIYTLYNVHIGSQSYLGIILHYIQNVCKNKCAVCTLYILHILDLARALVFNAAHSTLHKIAFRMNGR